MAGQGDVKLKSGIHCGNDSPDISDLLPYQTKCQRNPSAEMEMDTEEKHVKAAKDEEDEAQGQDIEAQDQQLVRYVHPPGTVKIGPDKEHRNIVAVCCEMDTLINNGLWEDFEKYSKLLHVQYSNNVDVQLNILYHTVLSHCVQNIVSSKTHELLESSKELIPKSTCPQYFEIGYLGMLSKVFIKDKQYGMVQCCIDNIYQKSKLLLPEKIVTLTNHRDAEYLIHQFQSKFATNSVPQKYTKEI